VFEGGYLKHVVGLLTTIVRNQGPARYPFLVREV
jgi:hypothetical protein